MLDRFLSLKIGRKRVGVLHDMELNRAHKESRLTEILSASSLERAAKEWLGKKSASVADQIAWLANIYHIDLFRVPQNFPVLVSEGMHKHNLDFEVVNGPLFSSRLQKTGLEAEMVREGNRCSAAGFRITSEILGASDIRKGLIFYENKALTSERLRSEIEIACLRLGGLAMKTIVAGGDQACDPHCEGSGALKANELIIVDVFPRMKKHGYFGDMTRTFLKGTASDAQRKLVDTVAAAHKLALSMVRGNVQGNKIHKAVQRFFDDKGYKTRKVNGVPTGFFHGTGHGLGLELHEPLRISVTKQKLKPGFVVTIEPGLYYPGLGGCRIEDVVLVTKTGSEMLSKAPYTWEIP